MAYAVSSPCDGTAGFQSNGGPAIFPFGIVAAPPVALTTNGAINPNQPAQYFITKAGVYAGTLAAPTATTSDGFEIAIYSNTANAHTITAGSALFNNGGPAATTVATFAAKVGASLVLVAYQGVWFVKSAQNVVFA